MTGIITDSLKRILLDNLITEIATGAASYYIGIGNSIDWDSSDTAPDPTNTLREERNLRLRLQSIKSGEDVSYVVPRNNWVSGTIYSGWDDNVSSHPTNPYFIITDDNGVYICLKQGRDATGAAVASTIKPTGSSVNSFFTADGYIWKFLYTLSAGNANKFLSANYVPVQFIASTDSSSPAAIVEQKSIQDAAVSGQIGNIRVIDGGSGYASAPTVTVVGDGDSCQATAIISGGSIVDVRLDSNGSGVPLHGNGYSKATITFNTGTATARAALAPKGGFGVNAINDLRAKALMFNSKPSGNESNTFITDNDFRQVTLIKNPTITATDSDFTQASGFTLSTLQFALPVGTAFSIDKTVLGGTSGAKGYVDTYNATTGLMYYHQTETTGFTSFQNGEAVTEVDGSGSGSIDSAGAPGLANGTVDWTSGEVLYIENRAAISRSAEQTEDIKIVIQL
jgi:hypothetical protein